MIIAVQCKMARAALGLGVRDLAKLADVSVDTVSRLERGEELMPRTVSAIRTALESAGATFLDAGVVATGPGVSLIKPSGASIDVDENEVVQYRENLESDAPPGAGG